ncbi:hypothetical protein I5M27_11765 [Adhaeribacter sp. BT258]|uniref:LPS export ABC transporter protein LptC n=1 Tax=Adhaeribacter terrigena TaxID=2793070 RepID=A0ABS1C2N9_9BACT|nr:hypothetical protein [Adhaeribacter terrigena]MBK0403666.1 hypothetical protein [Adhaeribacter terrigena]
MLRKLLFSGILIPFLGLAGCSDSAPVKPVSEAAYFDVPGFMQQQLVLLKKQQPALQKTVWVNHEKPETQQLQNINWEKELQHFLEIDLNKKALQGGYEVSEHNTAAGKRTVYTRKADVNTPIKTLEIFTDKANAVKELRAVSEEKNALFFNREERFLSLGTDQILQKYYVSGVQKVLLFDSLHYTAKASTTGELK